MLRHLNPSSIDVPIGIRMQIFSATRFLSGAAVLVVLCGPQPALAQPAVNSPRPIAAPAKPVAAPAARGGTACHNGMSFDRFLADLKQPAVAAGVSQRALAEAAPYLVYDQSIVNRDRGQRVFGQVFNKIRPQQGVRRRGQKCASASPDACGSVQPRREEDAGCRRLSSPRSGVWRAVLAPS